jgi:hypothetical protein
LTEKSIWRAHYSLNPSSPFSHPCLRKKVKCWSVQKKVQRHFRKMAALKSLQPLPFWLSEIFFRIMYFHLKNSPQKVITLKIESSLIEQTLFTTPGLSSTTKHGPTLAILLGSSLYQRESLTLCSPIRAILLTSIALCLFERNLLYISQIQRNGPRRRNPIH